MFKKLIMKEIGLEKLNKPYTRGNSHARERESKLTPKNINFSTLPEIQYEPRYSSRVLSNQEVAPNVIVIHLDRPENFTFQPGQYIWLVLPKRSKKYGIVDRRAYSISSSKDDKALELLIRLTGSDYLNEVQKLKEGDVVEIIGPMGSTFVPPDGGAVFVAGGTGISPFLSILRSKSKNKFLLYGFESPERPLYAKDELVKISQSQGYTVNFFSGPATLEHFRRISTETDDRPIFISGPQTFVNEVSSQLLHLGIKKDRMYFEGCYPEDSKIYNIKNFFKESYLEKSIERDYSATSLENIFFQITYQTSNHVIFTDINGVILYANNAAMNITGYTLHEMFGQTPRLWGGLMPSEYYNTIWCELKKGNSIKQPLLNRRKDGRLYTALGTISTIFEGKAILGYVATEEDITEIQNIDKAKTEFVSLASHQLRTPLSIINWYTEMLLSGDAGKLKPEQKKYLDEIYTGSQRMVELVNALLNVSRLELGTFTIEPELIDIAKLIQSVIDEQKPQIDEKKIKISSSFEKAIPRILADPKLLRMVVQNLLSNAVKYTPEGGKVELFLSLDKEKKNLLMKLSDTGYGIPKNQQDKIFSKLFRADNVREKDTEGTGLGLYIVKSIIEHSGGKVWFKSEQNKGTTFFVTLPLEGIKKKEEKQGLA